MKRKIMLAIIAIYAGNVSAQDKTIPWGKNKLDSKDYVLTFKRINKIAKTTDTIQVSYINAKKNSVSIKIIDSNKKTIKIISGELAVILDTTQRYFEILITKEIVNKNVVLKFVDTTKIPQHGNGQETLTPTPAEKSNTEMVPNSQNGFVQHLEEYWIPSLALLILGGVIFYFSKTKSGKRKKKELLKKATGGLEALDVKTPEKKQTQPFTDDSNINDHDELVQKKEVLTKIAKKLKLEKHYYKNEEALVYAIHRKIYEELDTLKYRLAKEKIEEVAKAGDSTKELKKLMQDNLDKEKEIAKLYQQLSEKSNELIEKNSEMSVMVGREKLKHENEIQDLIKQNRALIEQIHQAKTSALNDPKKTKFLSMEKELHQMKKLIEHQNNSINLLEKNIEELKKA